MELAFSTWTLFLTLAFAVSAFFAGDSFLIDYLEAGFVLIESWRLDYLGLVGLEASLVLLFDVYVGALLEELMLPFYELRLGITLILGSIWAELISEVELPYFIIDFLFLYNLLWSLGIAHLLFFDIWDMIRLSHWWASINWYWRFDKIQMSILLTESRLTIIYSLLFILTIFLLSIFELELIDRFVFLKRFSCKICVLLRLRDWFGKFVLFEFDADALVFLFFRHRSLPSTLASYVL